MEKNWAILDLGTNTFHLLIVALHADKSFKVLYKAEEFVKLGENGLGMIGEKPFQRGLDQIRKYKVQIDIYRPERIVAFATAAIREASNGDEFIRQIKNICPMEIHKISGDEEAELIYYGVRQVVDLSDGISLIMDVGGGSTEFILANREKIFWKQSFPVGASRLHQRFHHSDPISESEIVEVKFFLEEQLQLLIAEASRVKISRLVGASGSFDSIAMMISERFLNCPLSSASMSFPIGNGPFNIIYHEILQANLSERLKMKGLVWFRAEMMVVAVILMKFVIDRLQIREVIQSAYALKEGVLWKMLQDEKV